MTDIASKLEHAYCTAGLPDENPIRLAAARLRELEAECAEAQRRESAAYVALGKEVHRAGMLKVEHDEALALLREAMAYIDDDERPVPVGLELSDRIYALLAKEGA